MRSNNSQLAASAEMSPISVVPNRKHSASPAAMSACTCSGVRVRRNAMTLRSHCVKSGVGGHWPRAPVRSRCVCALTKPGRIATLPRSTSACAFRAARRRRSCRRAIVIVPRSIGGASIGKIQRAVYVV